MVHPIGAQKIDSYNGFEASVEVSGTPKPCVIRMDPKEWVDRMTNCGRGQSGGRNGKVGIRMRHRGSRRWPQMILVVLDVRKRAKSNESAGSPDPGS